MHSAISKKLNDGQLIKELKKMISQERKLLVEILEYLREVEVRKLHLARGYSSMFAFCVEFLGYSESEAHIRIQAMRLSKEIPAVAQKLADGQLSLTVAAMAQSEFRRENERRKETGAPAMRVEEKKKVLLDLESSSKRQAQKKLSAHFPLGPDQVKMSFFAGPELAAKIARLKELTAHRNYNGDLSQLVEIAVDFALERVATEKAEAPGAAKPKTARVSALGPDQVIRRRSRFISVKVKRLVWERSGGQCTFVDKLTGQRCSSRHGLEVDHVRPFSHCGSHDPANLRILCGAHHRFRL